MVDPISMMIWQYAKWGVLIGFEVFIAKYTVVGLEKLCKYIYEQYTKYKHRKSNLSKEEYNEYLRLKKELSVIQARIKELKNAAESTSKETNYMVNLKINPDRVR